MRFFSNKFCNLFFFLSMYNKILMSASDNKHNPRLLLPLHPRGVRICRFSGRKTTPNSHTSLYIHLYPFYRPIGPPARFKSVSQSPWLKTTSFYYYYVAKHAFSGVLLWFLKDMGERRDETANKLSMKL